MTVSQAIISWLQGFDSAKHGGMDKIDTEQQSSKVDSYSLVRAPVQNVKSYLSGRKVYTDHYTFQARLSSQTDPDRIENNEFGEVLEAWVKEQNINGNFPKIADATVQSVSVQTPFYVGKAGDNSNVYQMTIAIKYEKER